MKIKDYNNALIYAEIFASMAPIKGTLVEYKIKKYLNVINDEYVNNIIKKITEYKITDVKSTEILLSIINEYIIDKNEIVKTKVLLSLDGNNINKIETPCNFSKIDDFVFGCGIIKEKHLGILRSIGINKIINLIHEEKPSEEYIKLAKDNGIIVHYFPIEDKRETNPEVIVDIMNLLTDGSHSIVHCMGGIGRTNMVLCCYLIKTKNKSPSEAITILSQSRKIILTIPQMMFVKEYYAKYNNQTICNFDKAGLIMLIGIPCSGKSTISQELLNKYSNIIHINQDEL